MSDDATVTAPLALPSPPPEDEVEQLTVDGTQKFKFDKLGPVVVNSDGTLSRIANWEEMTPFEKERILRVLVARNKVRLAAQEQEQMGVGSSDDKLSISTNASEAQS